MKNNYTTIDTVIERVFRDFPQSENEFLWSDAIGWIGELLKLINVPEIQEDRLCIIDIEDFKGELPTDLFQAEMFMDNKTGVVLKFTGDPFFRNLHCSDSKCLTCKCLDSKYHYTLNNNYIFTGFDEGEVKIAYKSIPIDDRGYPKVPDIENVIRALYWEIALKLSFKLWMNNKIDDNKYKYIDQQRNWYVGKAINTNRIPDIGKMDAILNFTLRLIPKINILEDKFRSAPERRYNSGTNDFNQGNQS